MRCEKNNQVPILNPDRHNSVSGDTMLPPRLVFVTSYHPRLRFDSVDRTLGLDSINLMSVIFLLPALVELLKVLVE